MVSTAFGGTVFEFNTLRSTDHEFTDSITAPSDSHFPSGKRLQLSLWPGLLGNVREDGKEAATSSQMTSSLILSRLF